MTLPISLRRQSFLFWGWTVAKWVASLCFVVFINSLVVAEEPNIKVGLLEPMFADVPKTILDAMADPFRNLLMKQTSLNGDVVLCKDFQAMAKKLKDHSLSVGVFHGYEYAWSKKENPNLLPLLVTMPHGKKAQSMIVVRSDSEIAKIADLKDKPVTLCKGTKAFTRLYLDKMKATHREISVSPKPVTLTPEEALTAVATGQDHATITDASILHGYAQLQPGAFQKLRILNESELFPCSVIATDKGCMTDDEVLKITNGLGTASKTAQGRAMLTLWGLRGFEKVPEGYDDHCKKIMLAYPAPPTK